MIDDLNLILSFLWSTLDKVILLYFAGGILTFSFAIWIVKRVSKLFDYIVH